jgi:hypothetical protein
MGGGEDKDFVIFKIVEGYFPQCRESDSLFGLCHENSTRSLLQGYRRLRYAFALAVIIVNEIPQEVSKRGPDSIALTVS